MEIAQVFPLIIGSAGLLLSLYTIIDRHRDNNAKELAQQGEEIAKLREEVATLKTQIGVFWRVVEVKVSEMLHKPTHHERDKLLEKIRDNIKLTDAECDEMILMLDDIVEQREPTTPDERMAALLLMARLQSQKAARKGH